jgi:hypothetical protein
MLKLTNRGDQNLYEILRINFKNLFKEIYDFYDIPVKNGYLNPKYKDRDHMFLQYLP